MLGPPWDIPRVIIIVIPNMYLYMEMKHDKIKINSELIQEARRRSLERRGLI